MLTARCPTLCPNTALHAGAVHNDAKQFIKLNQKGVTKFWRPSSPACASRGVGDDDWTPGTLQSTAPLRAAPRAPHEVHLKAESFTFTLSTPFLRYPELADVRYLEATRFKVWISFYY